MNPANAAEVQFLTQKLVQFEELKTELEADIAAIDALTVSDPNVNAVIQENRTRLQNRLNSTNNTIAHFTERKTHLENCCFTPEQQVKVDAINTTFSNAFSDKLVALNRDTEERKTEFFTLYDACDNTAVCEQFLLSWR